MTDKEINSALKKALKSNWITEIPITNDEQLILLREIAVVSKGSYAFYYRKS